MSERGGAFGACVDGAGEARASRRPLVVKIGSSTLTTADNRIDRAYLRQVADQIAIMYGGIILEYGATKAALETPANPYTKALIAALPKSGDRARLTAIEGQPPTITHMPPGCPFSDRCAYATDACRAAIPELKAMEEDHMTACHMNLN